MLVEIHWPCKVGIVSQTSEAKEEILFICLRKGVIDLWAFSVPKNPKMFYLFYYILPFFFFLSCKFSPSSVNILRLYFLLRALVLICDCTLDSLDSFKTYRFLTSPAEILMKSGKQTLVFIPLCTRPFQGMKCLEAEREGGREWVWLWKYIGWVCFGIIWYHLFHPSSNTHSVALGRLAILEQMKKECPFIEALVLGLSFD